MSENWRPVVGYEGCYEVSDCGRVRGLERVEIVKGRWGSAVIRVPERVMRISKTRAGYRYLCLSKASSGTKYLVHRLVMAAFVGESDLQVNHKDGNPANNALSNLEYCTPSENLLHAVHVLGTRRGERVGTSKLKEADIPVIRADKRPLRDIANDYGVTLQAISLVKSRKNWGHVA